MHAVGKHDRIWFIRQNSSFCGLVTKHERSLSQEGDGITVVQIYVWHPKKKFQNPPNLFGHQVIWSTVCKMCLSLAPHASCRKQKMFFFFEASNYVRR